MENKSRRFPFVIAIMLVVALLTTSYVAAYVQLGKVQSWEVCGGRGAMRVRAYSSERVAKIFEPLAKLESKFIQQTTLAHKKGVSRTTPANSP